jgi:hypothetical protein
MPDWKKIIVSGSDAELNSLYAPSITGSLHGTASIASTASYATQALSASFVTLAQSASYVSSNFQYEIHVSQVDGNDTTGNGDLLKPVATIGKALLLVSASVGSTDRRTVIVHPGTYFENITINTTNTYFFSTGLLGANCLISGSVTISAATRMSGIKMTNLIVSSSNPIYINNCAVDKQMTVSGSGYLEVQNTSLQCTSGIQVVGPASSGVIFKNCSLYPLTVNNASAAVYVISCNQAITPTLTTGTLTITRSTISSLTSGATSTALTTAAGSVLVLESCNVYNSLLTSHAAITANGFYSIKNVIYNRPASTLASLSGTGGPLATVTQFQYINADNINSTQGLTVTGSINVSGSVINNLTSSFALTASYVNPLRQEVLITGSLIVSASGGVNDFRVGTNDLFVSASGEIGIGITTPTAKLHVNNTGNINSFLVEDETNPDTTPFVIDRFGRTGIGTPTPTAVLHVSGNANSVRYEGDNHVYQEYFPQGISAGRFGFIGYGSSGSKDFRIYNESGDGRILLGTSGSTLDFRMSILGDGNVGVGITTPTAKLHVNNTSTSASFLVEDSANPDSSPFVIDASGNVAIGTGSAFEKVTIQNGNIALKDLTNSTQTSIVFTPSDTSSRNYITTLNSASATDDYMKVGSWFGSVHLTTGNITSPTTHLFVSRSGNIGVGITSSLNAKLHVNNIGTDNSFLVEDSTNPDTTPFVINNAGNVGIGTTTPNTKLDVNGNTTITGSLNVTAGITGSLFGTASWANNVLTSSYVLPLNQNVQLTGSLNVSGSTLFEGIHTLSGSNTITGNTVLSGSLEVSGSSNFKNSIFILTGSTHFKGIHTISGSTEITGSFNVIDGNINIVSGSSFTRWGNKLFNYGQFSDSTTQSGSANTAYAMKLNTTDFSLNTRIVSQSRITVDNTGIYNLQFSTQLGNTANTAIDFDIWFAYTGSNIANSNTQLTLNKVPGSLGKLVAAWNFMTPIYANDYIEIMWSCTAATGQLQSQGTQTGPTRPATPSVIATLTQIA